MPDCHKCEHYGRYTGKRFEDTPCAKCLDRPLTGSEVKAGMIRWTGDDPAHHGRNHISIDAGADEQTLGEVLAAEHSESYTDGLSDAYDRFRLFLAQLLTLDRLDSVIIQRRWLALFDPDHHTFARIARDHQITVQAASARYNKVLRKWPTIRALFPQSKTTQEARKGRKGR